MKRKRKLSIENENVSSFKRKCPFINKPYDYCYCSSTNSLYVKNVILYCGGNFEDCELYQNTMKLK